MKKLFTFCAIALFAAFSVNAQVSFGVKGGLAFGYIHQKIDAYQSPVTILDITTTFDVPGESVTSDIQLGFYGGFFADIEVSDMFHIQPELNFSMEGGDEISFSFIQLPVIAKFYVSDKFSIQAGPQVSLLVDVENFEDDFGGDLGDVFNVFNFGANFGLGYDFSDHFFIEGRYSFMLSNMAKDISLGDLGNLTSVFVEGLVDLNLIDVEVKSKQHSFKIGVGYKF